MTKAHESDSRTKSSVAFTISFRSIIIIGYGGGMQGKDCLRGKGFGGVR